MAGISLEDVEYAAELARLDLQPDEKEALVDQLGRILQYIGKLNELDTEGVEPTSHVLTIQNVFRKDRADEPMNREDALQLAPDASGAFFQAPKVIE